MEKLDPLERQEVTHQRDARLPRALSLAPRARAWRCSRRPWRSAADAPEEPCRELRLALAAPAGPARGGAGGVAPPPCRAARAAPRWRPSASRRCFAGARRWRRPGRRGPPPGSGSPRSALVCWRWPVRSWASARAELARTGRDVLLLLDLSRSMTSERCRRRDRLAAAKAARLGDGVGVRRATGWGSSSSAGARSSSCRSLRTGPRSGSSSTRPAPTIWAIPRPTSPPRCSPR